jgi:hypothetical protein
VAGRQGACAPSELRRFSWQRRTITLSLAFFLALCP